MRLFDTHCHFESTSRDEISALLARAREAGVECVMAIGGSRLLNESAALAGTMGTLVAQGCDRDQNDLAFEDFEPSCPLAAWGEIGLDYHYEPVARERQCRLFARQLELAHAADLPVVIHTREADEDTLALLREQPSRGIIHSFTGSTSFVRELLDLGFYISISGIVTFKSADNVRESARYIPDDRLLIETDSPYLAPVPKRGQPNEPAFLRYTCEFLASLRGISPDSLADLTYTNAAHLLGL